MRTYTIYVNFALLWLISYSVFSWTKFCIHEMHKTFMYVLTVHVWTLANSHGSSRAISTVKFRQEEMKKVVIIVVPEILDVIHCCRLKNPYNILEAGSALVFRWYGKMGEPALVGLIKRASPSPCEKSSVCQGVCGRTDKCKFYNLLIFSLQICSPLFFNNISQFSSFQQSVSVLRSDILYVG